MIGNSAKEVTAGHDIFCIPSQGRLSRTGVKHRINRPTRSTTPSAYHVQDSTTPPSTRLLARNAGTLHPHAHGYSHPTPAPTTSPKTLASARIEIYQSEFTRELRTTIRPKTRWSAYRPIASSITPSSALATCLPKSTPGPFSSLTSRSVARRRAIASCVPSSKR